MRSNKTTSVNGTRVLLTTYRRTPKAALGTATLEAQLNTPAAEIRLWDKKSNMTFHSLHYLNNHTN